MTPGVTYLPARGGEGWWEGVQGTTRRQGSISVTLAMGESSGSVEVITPAVSDSNSPLPLPLSLPLLHNPNRFHSIPSLAHPPPRLSSSSRWLSVVAVLQDLMVTVHYTSHSFQTRQEILHPLPTNTYLLSVLYSSYKIYCWPYKHNETSSRLPLRKLHHFQVSK